MMPVKRSQQWLPSIFNDFFGNEWIPKISGSNVPAVNIIESDKEYRVEVAAPGMTKEDFNVHIENDNELVISMEKKQESKDEEKGKYLKREFSYTQFKQTMLLPDNVDKERVDAGVDKGVLTIVMSKKEASEPKASTKKIEIK